jgi:hypothetical protein
LGIEQVQMVVENQGTIISREVARDFVYRMPRNKYDSPPSDYMLHHKVVKECMPNARGIYRHGTVVQEIGNLTIN